jgi:glycosyltransferase involved in cell wall biosynthesis
MPKILMINTVLSQGGAAKMTRALHNALNETTDFSSCFAYGRGPKLKNEKTFRFSFCPEVYFHAFLIRFLGLEGFGTWFSAKRLIDYIKKNNFDLIHLHNLHGYYLDLSFIQELKALRLPVVWTFHDDWPITGRCTHSFGCERWKMGCGNCPDLSLPPKTYFFDLSALIWKRKKEQFSKGWNPIIVCPSQRLANKIRKSFLNRYQIEVIPNGIDITLFKPKDKTTFRKKFGLPISKKIILFAAPTLNDKQKGAKYFLESLKYIKNKDWMVLTLGKKLGFDIEKKINFNIKQLGYIPNPNLVSEVYNTADIFCITSFDDTFPTAVLESMACGVPVVGFKTGGIPEQVSNNCGILVEPKNIEGLAKAIDGALNDTNLRNEFSLNCRKRALNNYSIENFKNRYVNLYKNILNKLNF